MRGGGGDDGQERIIGAYLSVRRLVDGAEWRWYNFSAQQQTYSIPIAVYCLDGVPTGDEEGVDCGGAVCRVCVPSCGDGVQNQDEFDVDCGGPCPPCPPRSDGLCGREFGGTLCPVGLCCSGDGHCQSSFDGPLNTPRVSSGHPPRPRPHAAMASSTRGSWHRTVAGPTAPPAVCGRTAAVGPSLAWRPVRQASAAVAMGGVAGARHTNGGASALDLWRQTLPPQTPQSVCGGVAVHRRGL